MLQEAADQHCGEQRRLVLTDSSLAPEYRTAVRTGGYGCSSFATNASRIRTRAVVLRVGIRHNTPISAFLAPSPSLFSVLACLQWQVNAAVHWASGHLSQSVDE